MASVLVGRSTLALRTILNCAQCAVIAECFEESNITLANGKADFICYSCLRRRTENMSTISSRNLARNIASLPLLDSDGSSAQLCFDERTIFPIFSFSLLLINSVQIIIWIIIQFFIFSSLSAASSVLTIRCVCFSQLQDNENFLQTGPKQFTDKIKEINELKFNSPGKNRSSICRLCVLVVKGASGTTFRRFS